MQTMLLSTCEGLRIPGQQRETAPHQFSTQQQCQTLPSQFTARVQRATNMPPQEGADAKLGNRWVALVASQHFDNNFTHNTPKNAFSQSLGKSSIYVRPICSQKYPPLKQNALKNELHIYGFLVTHIISTC